MPACLQACTSACIRVNADLTAEPNSIEPSPPANPPQPQHDRTQHAPTSGTRGNPAGPHPIEFRNTQLYALTPLTTRGDWRRPHLPEMSSFSPTRPPRQGSDTSLRTEKILAGKKCRGMVLKHGLFYGLNLGRDMGSTTVVEPESLSKKWSTLRPESGGRHPRGLE